MIAFEVVEETLRVDELQRDLDYGNGEDLAKLAHACELDETLEPLFAGAPRWERWSLIVGLKDAAMIREREQMSRIVDSFEGRGGFRGLSGG